ncbi:SDR family NAD(P)-dependent oxidoreductase [Bacillus sp. JJ722]|uniref:SDR family NAD(P)-dependent oxidoreductase n=1 Tax=Bacillus sp. JJ722 TaxID=3122973 RepID=UPI002FFDFEED
MNKLEGKVAIITGGSSGIGKATTELFLAHGAKVVVADISNEAKLYVEGLVKEGGEAIFVQTDVSKETDVQNAVNKAVNKFGKLDIMIANAGIGHRDTPIKDYTLSQWQQMIDINLTGVFLSNKYAITQMQEQGTGGSIVNIASIMGHTGRDGQASYNAAKAGVANLTRSLAISHAKEDIRINAVNPGFIYTPILSGASDEALEKVASLHPIGRLGRVEEVANAILFLASNDASFIVGTNLMVDGGYTAI